MAAADIQQQEGVLWEWGHDTANRRPLDLLVAHARRQHAMTALQFQGTSKWGIILFGGQQGGRKLLRRCSVTHWKE